MVSLIIEPNEWLRIEVEDDGYSDHQNGTWQGADDGLAFTVETYIGFPGGIETKEQLARHIERVLTKLVNVGEEVAFVVCVGDNSGEDT